MLFVHLGTPEDGAKFFDKRWPEARAVSDEKEVLYDAFELSQRGTLAQFLGGQPIVQGWKATLQGHLPGLPVGNPLRMSGWFLVRGEQIVWSDVHTHAGTERPYDEIRRISAKVA